MVCPVNNDNSLLNYDREAMTIGCLRKYVCLMDASTAAHSHLNDAGGRIYGKIQSYDKHLKEFGFNLDLGPLVYFCFTKVSVLDLSIKYYIFNQNKKLVCWV